MFELKATIVNSLNADSQCLKLYFRPNNHFAMMVEMEGQKQISKETIEVAVKNFKLLLIEEILKINLNEIENGS